MLLFNKLFMTNLVKKANSGQTLVEAIIALSVLMIVLSASSIVVISALNNTTFLKNQNEANKLAQQLIEYIRNIKTNDYSTFKGWTGNYCVGDPSVDGTYNFNSSATCDTPNIGNFVREVNFSDTDTDCLISAGVFGTRVRVRTKWSSGKCSSGEFCHMSEIITCFTDRTATP